MRCCSRSWGHSSTNFDCREEKVTRAICATLAEAWMLTPQDPFFPTGAEKGCARNELGTARSEVATGTDGSDHTDGELTPEIRKRARHEALGRDPRPLLFHACGLAHRTHDTRNRTQRGNRGAPGA